MKFVVMDHLSGKDQETPFEDFMKKMKTWIAPGYWINVQFSDGSPDPIESFSLITKAEV